MATNTFLFPGDNDWLAQPGDILKLIMHLPNIVENYQVRKYYLMSIHVVLAGNTSLSISQFFLLSGSMGWMESLRFSLRHRY